MNTLSLKSIGILFAPILWLMFCKAQLNAPSDRLVFAPGEDGRIVWTYSGDINQITFQGLRFTGASIYLVFVARGIVVDRISNGLDFQFVLPLTLILKNVNPTYNGTYIMEVGLASGTLPPSPVHIFIAVAPKIYINCSSTTTLNVSDYFSCECKGEDGNPPAVVTWYKGNGRIISGEGMATLTIARVDRDDNGLYRCEAKGDEKAKAEKTVQIIVNYRPANISLTLQREGHKATLICTAEGRPQPNFEIFSKRSKLVYKGSTYTFDIVKSCDFGNYTCKATNILGSAISHDVHVQTFKDIKNSTTSIVDCKTDWLVTSISVLSGIILGFCFVV
ncbi:opioid-binding protein/cell adhesion molecule-like [Xenia sp. Carnegie-2017]|uniref:opioid-binding protein/cell adhesion molecule-like n=1 Tax=Xenia sp. Carnegie-2017 TaxID=2897299 RepID=UPI001F036FC0|nr:opioid-binding protein/cell adhesion molecule-like [Xenia sp. Carnegie-2017]XP_046857385.1 opioid-binding protein/cell adhesion molecule-like [Xenia sp. Carnegie-2017]